jgi:hypothetical protein
MIYYLIITWFVGLIWYGLSWKKFKYPILTIILGGFFGPISIPLRIILKLLS